MSSPSENHWLCWSPRQNAFHVESETDGLKTNRRAFRENSKLDYIPIGKFSDIDQACAEADRLRNVLRERDAKRRL